MKKIKAINRWRMLTGFVLLLAMAVVWGLRNEKDDSSTPVKPQPSVDNAATPSNDAIPGLRWQAGSSQQYQVTFDSAMRMESIAGGGSQTIRVKMTCLLDMHTLEIIDRGALVGMQLSAVELRVNGQADPQTNTALATPFRVRFTAQGVPESFEFPADVTAKHRSMLEKLVQTFQVTMEDGSTWVAQESNASGVYEATYRQTGPGQLEKIKSHVYPLSSGSMLAGAAIDSMESIRIDPQHDWIAAMNVDEILRTQDHGRLTLEVTNLATIKLQSTVPAVTSDSWNFIAAAAPPETEAATPVPDMTAQEARRQILVVLPELDTATESRTAWIHRLRDLLRVDASLPAILLEEMKTQPFSDRTRADLYLALELAGTDSAQAALVAVVEDAGWSTRDGMRAIVALAGVNRPSADTLSVLWETAESVPTSDDGQHLANTATLALGSLGNSMNAKGDPEYPALRERLLNGALSSTGSDVYLVKRTNYVHALGNTGDASLAEDVVIFLDDDAPSVRRAAALSLGTLGTDPAAEELMAHLGQEKSSQVRGAIAQSLVKWTTPSAAAMASISTAVRAEPDENTRYNMARFLGANLDAFPENKAILRDLLRTEQSKRIRQNVAESLASHTR